jgi:uncharacterized membrane protein YtjA (UPF0391 family)
LAQVSQLRRRDAVEAAFSRAISRCPGWHGSCLTGDRTGASAPLEKDFVMLHWAAVFFVIALLAAVFGFGGIAASAVGVAKILFVVFLVLAVVSLIFGRRVST